MDEGLSWTRSLASSSPPRCSTSLSFASCSRAAIRRSPRRSRRSGARSASSETRDASEWPIECARKCARWRATRISGQAVFKRVCALCHKIYGEGQDVGPDLTLNGRNDFDQLISNIFDPNLVIGPGYQAATIATTEGRILIGLVVENGSTRVVLKLQGGSVETIQRGQIEEMKMSELSLMPDSFDTQLTPQEIADLCAFLSLDKPPSDPAAKALPGAGPMVRPGK